MAEQDHFWRELTGPSRLSRIAAVSLRLSRGSGSMSSTRTSRMTITSRHSPSDPGGLDSCGRSTM